MALVSRIELIKLQKSLGKDKTIAEKLGVTRQRIQQLRQDYGIDSRYAKNPQRNKDILALFKAGKRRTEIAKKVGLSITHINRLIAGMQGRKKELSGT